MAWKFEIISLHLILKVMAIYQPYEFNYETIRMGD